MNLLAILGSPRKGQSTDQLLDKVIEGVVDAAPDTGVNKVYLIDKDIQHCQNCLACRDSRKAGSWVPCKIRDDMDELYPLVEESDLLAFGTPVHMGFATGLMTCFLERICWTFAKPDKSYLTLHGCPLPRGEKRRRAAIVVSSAIVPPLYRRLCDQATPLISQTIADSLGAKTVGSIYAGDLEHRGAEHYFGKATKLGQRLVR